MKHQPELKDSMNSIDTIILYNFLFQFSQIKRREGIKRVNKS